MSACISVSWTVFGAITMTEIRKHFILNPIKEEVMFFVMFVCVCVCYSYCLKKFWIDSDKKKKKMCRVGFWLQAINIWIRCTKVFKANLMLYWSKIDKNFQ